MGDEEFALADSLCLDLRNMYVVPDLSRETWCMHALFTRHDRCPRCDVRVGDAPAVTACILEHGPGPAAIEAVPNLLGYRRREVPFIARPLFNPNPPSQAPSSPPLPTYPVALTLAPQRAAPCHVRCRAPAPASITFAFTPTCGVRVVSASERE